MRLVEPWIKVEKFDGIQIMKKLERACRTCYRSEGKVTEDSYKNLLKNCITRGHDSILEHETITIRVRCDVGFYKDVTRHRGAVYSVESTRFCSYDKDKYGNEIAFMDPSAYMKDKDIFENWKKCMEEVEKRYMEMKKLGATTDMCRLVLPHSTAAEMTMTANIKIWKHILGLRTTKNVHPSIRQSFIPLLKLFQKEMPEIFEDVEYDTEFPESAYAKLTIVDEI